MYICVVYALAEHYVCIYNYSRFPSLHPNLKIRPHSKATCLELTNRIQIAKQDYFSLWSPLRSLVFRVPSSLSAQFVRSPIHNFCFVGVSIGKHIHKIHSRCVIGEPLLFPFVLFSFFSFFLSVHLFILDTGNKSSIILAFNIVVLSFDLLCCNSVVVH